MIRELHDQAERVGGLVEEGFFEGDDEGCTERSENSDFVQSHFFLFGGELGEFDFFEGVEGAVVRSLDFVDGGVGSFA